MIFVLSRDVNETRDSENFSVSRIVFLAVENLRLLDHMLSLRSFNGARYASHLLTACARVKLTDSVTEWVDSIVVTLGEGEEGEPPAAT